MVAKKALQYHCYRQFLLDFITSSESSYRGFAASYAAYISFPFLSKLLRRNGAGEFTKEVNLSPEKLAALLTAMGIDAEGVAHLVLCRLENDSRVGVYRHSSAFVEVLHKVRSSTSANAYAKILEALESLIMSRRQKVIEELKAQLLIEMERSTSPLKAQKLKGLLEAM